MAKLVQSSSEGNMGSASGESAPTTGSLWQARPMIVTVHESGGAEATVTVDKPFARVGRDRRAEVHVGGPSVLPCQLYLHATDDGIYCLSLSADASSGWLTAGSTIRVGDHRVSAAFAEGPPARPGLADLCARYGAVGPAPLITIAAGRQQIAIRDVALHRQLTLIGRQAPGTLCVRHRTISRAHCVLFWDGRRLWMIDLLSSNGTRLEGERFDAGPVPQGGTFRLGDIRFHFVTTTPLDDRRSGSDSAAGLLDVPADSDLLPGMPAETIHEIEAVHGADLGARGGPVEWDERFRELAGQLREQREETERLLAAHEVTETKLTKQLAQLEAELASATTAMQQDRELLLGEAAEREAKLAAMHESLASLEEKLVQTEAKFAASPVEVADDRQAAEALEERLQAVAEQLAEQRQQQMEERARLEKQLAAHEAAEAKLAKQLVLVETKLADALTTAQQERELLLGEAAEREVKLAAMHASLTSFEEKLARTEAKLAPPPVEAAADRQAAEALEERIQLLAEQLAEQRQQQTEERARLEKQLAAQVEARETATAWEERLQALADGLKQQRDERARWEADREATQTSHSVQVADLKAEMASARSAAQQDRELMLGELADREASLAAMRESLASLGEKLARTEARLAATSAQAADDRQAASAREQRFQELEARLARQDEEISARDAALIGHKTSDDAPSREALTAIEERIVPLEAKLNALAQQVKSPTRQVVARDNSRAAAPSGEWMLDDEHTRRLLAFRHKRESKRRWRQLAWAATVILVITAGAVATSIYLNNRNESAANLPPAPGSETSAAGFEP